VANYCAFDGIASAVRLAAHFGEDTMKTVRLTMAQALVRFLCAQKTMIDGRKAPLFAGLFGIFGHGNVTCLSEALEQVPDQLPTWRGQNEQSMALAAIGFAKAMQRRQIMVAAASIGPGALNMVTAAGAAHANRLPVLLLAGDVFASRIPDPVLQQVEQFHDPPGERRLPGGHALLGQITRPEQILTAAGGGGAARPGRLRPVFSAFVRTRRARPMTIRRASSPSGCWRRPRPDAREARAVAPIKGHGLLPIAYGGAREMTAWRSSTIYRWWRRSPARTSPTRP
jgi:3D-(3,5/4)-trihydroxycyclohexane-1,2-dione acylhydrolase (decyclizing)